MLYSLAQAAAPASEMTNSDPKRIAREWNREIDREIGRLAAPRAGENWKIVIWLALAGLWFVALVAGLSLVRSLQW